MKDVVIYLGVQVVAYGLDMGTFVAAHRWLTIDPVPANVLAKIVAGTFAFFMHRHVTFSASARGGIFGQSARYVAALAANAAAATILLSLLIMFGVQATIAKFVSDVVLFVVSFVIAKSFVFRPRES